MAYRHFFTQGGYPKLVIFQMGFKNLSHLGHEDILLLYRRIISRRKWFKGSIADVQFFAHFHEVPDPDQQLFLMEWFGQVIISSNSKALQSGINISSDIPSIMVSGVLNSCVILV